MDKQPFDYYLNLVKNGEVLTEVEISNAKKLLRRGCNENYETCLAVVLRNRHESANWNEWYYHRFARTPRGGG